MRRLVISWGAKYRHIVELYRMNGVDMNLAGAHELFVDAICASSKDADREKVKALVDALWRAEN